MGFSCSICRTDFSLLDRIGACALKLELLSLARQCFERCLRLKLDDQLAVARLVEVVAACGDREAYGRLRRYARFLNASRWAPGGVERLPTSNRDEKLVGFALQAPIPVLTKYLLIHQVDMTSQPSNFFCKRRRLSSEPPSVDPLVLVWHCDPDVDLSFEQLYNFLLGHLETLYSQNKPCEALTRPMSIEIVAKSKADDDSVKSMPLESSLPEDNKNNGDGSVFSKSDNEAWISQGNSVVSCEDSICDDDDNDNVQALLVLLNHALPQETISVHSDFLSFEEGADADTAVSTSSSAVDEKAMVEALTEAATASQSGLSIALHHIWNATARSPPHSLSVERLLSIRQVLLEKASLQPTLPDVLFTAEIYFDRLSSESLIGDRPTLVTVARLMHQLEGLVRVYLSPSADHSAVSSPELQTIEQRICWLFALWHMFREAHVTAHHYLLRCSSLGIVVRRARCVSDRIISPGTIASKLDSLTVWELCESAGRNDASAVAELLQACRSESVDFSGVPPAIFLAALAALRQRVLDNETSFVVLLRLIVALVPNEGSFAPETLDQFRTGLDQIISKLTSDYDDDDECVIAAISRRLSCDVGRCLSRSLFTALRDDLPMGDLSRITLALLLTSCHFGSTISLDASAQAALFDAGHTFLARFDGACCADEFRYLRVGLDSIMFSAAISDVTDHRRFDQISAAFCCLYGPLDPRFECHGEHDVITIGTRALSPETCGRLLDYCIDADRFLPDDDQQAFASRCVSLLRQLHDSIPFPSNVQPADDFLGDCLESVKSTTPPIALFDGNQRLYHRYYDHFAQRIVNLYDLCSYATRVPSTSSSDLVTLQALLRTDIRLHPIRIRSWYRLAWVFIHQRIGFIQGVESSVEMLAPYRDDPNAAESLQDYFLPLIRARGCLQRCLKLYPVLNHDVPELGVSMKPSAITEQRLIHDLFVLEFRLLEFVTRFTMNASVVAIDILRSMNLEVDMQNQLVCNLLREHFPSSPKRDFLSALVGETCRAPDHDIMELYARAAQDIPDAQYAQHALRLDRAMSSASPDWRLICSYSYQDAIEPNMQGVMEDVAMAFRSCCDLDPEFFRPALRLAQLALATRSPDLASSALSDLTLFVNDKTRLRRIRPRRGSLSPTADDTEFIRALIYDPKLDTAEDDCLAASLLLCRRLGRWDDLDSIYYNAVRPRRDKRISLIYASALIGALEDWAHELRNNATIGMRDSLFKRAFECCLDLMRGKRHTQTFLPALLVLPYRIVSSEGPGDADIGPSDLVDADEVKRARTWCSELQCARAIRTALQNTPVASPMYDIRKNLIVLSDSFESFRYRR